MSPYAPGLRADPESASACNKDPARSIPTLIADNQSQSTNISETAKLLLAGGVAGALSKSATAPLARLTILYQVLAHHLCLGWFSLQVWQPWFATDTCSALC